MSAARRSRASSVASLDSNSDPITSLPNPPIVQPALQTDLSVSNQEAIDLTSPSPIPLPRPAVPGIFSAVNPLDAYPGRSRDPREPPLLRGMSAIPHNWDDPESDDEMDECDPRLLPGPKNSEEAVVNAYLKTRQPDFPGRQLAMDNGIDLTRSGRSLSEPLLDHEKSLLPMMKPSPAILIEVPELTTEAYEAARPDEQTGLFVLKRLKPSLDAANNNAAIALNRSTFSVAYQEVMMETLLRIEKRLDCQEVEVELARDDIRELGKMQKKDIFSVPGPSTASSGHKELQEMSSIVRELQRQNAALNSKIDTLVRNRAPAAPARDASGYPPVPPKPQPPKPNHPPPQPPRPPPPPQPQQPSQDYEQAFEDLYDASLTPEASWFTRNANKLHIEIIRNWVKILMWGNYGPVNSGGNPSGINPNNSTDDQLRAFVHACIARAFNPTNGYRFLPVPPKPYTNIGSKAESLSLYDWIIYTGMGPIPNRRPGQPVKVVEPPTNSLPPKPQRRNPRNGLQPPQPQLVNDPVDHYDPFAPTTSGVGYHAPAPQSSPELYYEDLYPVPDPWNHVGKGKNKALTNQNSYAAKASSPPSRRPAPQNRPRREDPTQEKWVLKFPKDQKISPGAREDPSIVVDRINRQCEHSYKIHARYAEWTEAGNLVIGFTSSTRETAVKNAEGTIRNMFSNGHPGVSFSKTVPWSKVSMPKVPCQGTMSDSTFLDPELLEQAVRDSHELLKDVPFVQKPDWAMDPKKRTPDITHSTVSFGIVDPDGSILSQLSKSVAFMFGTRVFPVAWKEKVDLSQCSGCWQFGPQHAACTQVCIYCGSTQHSSDDHNVNCSRCKETAAPIEEIQSEEWTCHHLRCRNCGGDHPASSEHCPGRNKAVYEARRRKKGMTGQTHLDPRQIGRPAAGRR